MKNPSHKTSYRNRYMKKYSGGTNSGLTIVESLVAISVLVISVLGPMVIISQALRTSFFARDQMTAYYLAQEAIEHVRNLRDRNSFRNIFATEWLQEMTYQNGTLEPTPAIADTSTPNPQKYSLVRVSGGYQLIACPSNQCAKLNVNTDTGTYGETTGASLKPSNYTREVIFYKTNGDTSATHDISIEVTMKWNQVGGLYQYKLRENLSNWKLQNFPN